MWSVWRCERTIHRTSPGSRLEPAAGRRARRTLRARSARSTGTDASAGGSRTSQREPSALYRTGRGRPDVRWRTPVRAACRALQPPGRWRNGPCARAFERTRPVSKECRRRVVIVGGADEGRHRQVPRLLRSRDGRHGGARRPLPRTARGAAGGACRRVAFSITSAANAEAAMRGFRRTTPTAATTETAALARCRHARFSSVDVPLCRSMRSTHGIPRLAKSVRTISPRLQCFRCVPWTAGSSRIRAPRAESRMPRSTSSSHRWSGSKPPTARNASRRTAPSPVQNVVAGPAEDW